MNYHYGYGFFAGACSGIIAINSYIVGFIMAICFGVGGVFFIDKFAKGSKSTQEKKA